MTPHIAKHLWLPLLALSACGVDGTLSVQPADSPAAESSRVCTNPPLEVFTHTCQQVGYPQQYSGSYVSKRQLNCATGTYGAWVREDTCRSSRFSFTAVNNSVDLRRYFPPGARTNTLRGASGKRYAAYTFRGETGAVLPNSNLTSTQLYRGYFDLRKPGSVYVWEKSYEISGALCTPTIAHLFLGDDLSVTEVGDWLAADGCHPNYAFGYRSAANPDAPDGLAWSAAGGLRTPSSASGVPYPSRPERYGIGIATQGGAGGTYARSNGSHAWSLVHVVETLPTYTPAYGRSSQGWAAGRGKTYNDVVRVILYHGPSTSSDISCWSQLKYTSAGYAQTYVHLAGYATYASEFYFAPGVGIIQESFLYAESGAWWGQGNCSMGLVFKDDQSAAANSYFIDDP